MTRNMLLLNKCVCDPQNLARRLKNSEVMDSSGEDISFLKLWVFVIFQRG